MVACDGSGMLQVGQQPKIGTSTALVVSSVPARTRRSTVLITANLQLVCFIPTLWNHSNSNLTQDPVVWILIRLQSSLLALMKAPRQISLSQACDTST